MADDSAPDTPAPNTTAPDTTAPDTTEPDTTEPGTSEPDIADERTGATAVPPQTPGPWFVVRGTVREFLEDGMFDQSAALTYFAVLSVVPAGITLVSLVNLFGQEAGNLQGLIEELRGFLPRETLETLTGILQVVLTGNSGAGIGITAGTITSLWTASLYVRAFGRAMNRVYDVPEGRPLWRLWPQMVLVTAVLLVLIAVSLVLVAVSGPVAETVGHLLGLGSAVVPVWNVAKWPLLVVFLSASLALLYYYTPNVRLPRMRWFSVGALVALATGGAASFGFGVYVREFATYDLTYGALAGLVIFLLWLWIMNLAILFGAELDCELGRAAQLRRGLPAEDSLILAPRATRASDRAADKRDAAVEQGRSMRLSAALARKADSSD